MANRHEHVLERGPPERVGVHVSCDHGFRADVRSKIAQERVATGIAALERPLELDIEAVAEGSRELDGRVRVADAEPGAGAAREADEALARLGEQGQV